MKNSVNIGIIGLGCRGSSMAEVMIKMDDINVLAVCDKYPDRVENTIKKIVSKGRPAPMGTTDYNDILNMPGIDTVYIATDWECHVKIAIEAMKKGIPAAMEVGGAYTLDECWELVDTYEETGVWTMMMENCCYGEREMMVHNMVRDGVLGDLVFCSGQYAHDLREEVTYGEKNRHYRLRNYISRNCENYPTHELGPIANILEINRGNRFVSMTSVCSKAMGLKDYVKQKKDLRPSLGSAEFAQADIVKTFIKTERGELIELTLDTCLPRFYSRGFTVRGTKGLYQEDGDIVYLDKSTKHMYELNNKVRLIDVSQFQFENSSEFIGFVCGVITQDHDLQQMYFDSFLKIACLEGQDITATVEKLEKLSSQFDVDFVLSVSMDESELPAGMKEKVIVSL